MKITLMYVFLATTVFFVSATVILYMKGDTPAKTLFDDWKGWVAVVVSLVVGGGAWYYFEKRKE